jgi:hypothetical protein
MAAEKINKTILYITDSALEPVLAQRCRDLLVKASCGFPIVSVSQEPLSLGLNVCVGKIGRSGLNIDLQIKAGLERVETIWVAIAEHDCVYSSEHFQWIPPDDKYFWYNDNVWLMQLENAKYPKWNGMYSYVQGRRCQSQLICSAVLLREATEKKLEVHSDPAWQERYPTGRIGEPGNADFEKTMAISRYEDVRHLRQQLKDYITKYGARDFNTTIPNIDIRHESNLTGPRRGKKRRFELPPWGRIEDVLHG